MSILSMLKEIEKTALEIQTNAPAVNETVLKTVEKAERIINRRLSALNYNGRLADRLGKIKSANTALTENAAIVAAELAALNATKSEG